MTPHDHDRDRDRDQDRDREGDRVVRLARTLRRLYPQLFDATTRGQQARERDSRNPARNDRPGPARVEVLDLIREVNAACLELHVLVLNQLGLPPASPPVDVRYRQSPRVTDALTFLERAAPAIQQATLPDGAPLGPYVAGWLGALVAEARRLLGYTGPVVQLTERVGVRCPVVLDEDGERCGGALVGLPALGLVTCRACGTRWHHADWDFLGRTVRAERDAAQPQEPEQARDRAA